MATSRTRIRVGTAGWSIPRDHAAAFGEGASTLARYATRLDAVEINTSFYRPHQAATYARWAAAVPAGFRFSVKLPQTISHELALRAAGPALDRFLDEVAGLGRKLGGLLLQLPPSLAFDARTASTFFRLLRRRTSVPLTCEPRHASWFTPAAEALLLRHEVGRAAADPARWPAAAQPGAAPAWPYFRWHGSPRMYYSGYDEEALQALAAEVRAWARGRQSPWVIFDNTAHGFAARDALRLRELLELA
ncbi:MAG TPA: DUF72 domain-containing protein [Stenotrophomonas sp.]|nr:DUF72 domain-containing protein [Stenotrophomonas sp.]